MCFALLNSAMKSLISYLQAHLKLLLSSFVGSLTALFGNSGEHSGKVITEFEWILIRRIEPQRTQWRHRETKKFPSALRLKPPWLSVVKKSINPQTMTIVKLLVTLMIVALNDKWRLSATTQQKIHSSSERLVYKNNTQSRSTR